MVTSYTIAYPSEYRDWVLDYANLLRISTELEDR